MKKREIPFGRPQIGDEEKTAVAEVLSGHILTHGPYCQSFEELFADRIGARHAITTSSCTTALHLSLLAQDVKAGDEVIVPAMTHVATGHVVEHCGARPIFVDVDTATGNIDPGMVEAAITERTKAIMVVHYLGLPADMSGLMRIARDRGLAIIEDAALALGADYGGKAPGTIGSSGCFSFYPTKHITTMEGGMLTTNDDDLAARVRQKRAFGYDRTLNERKVPGVYDIVTLGYNYRMSEAQAAVGVCQLSKLDGFLERRRNNAESLRQQIADLDVLTIFPFQQDTARSSYYCVNVTLPADGSVDRGAFISGLNDAGVGTSVHYPVALPMTTYYRDKYDYAPDSYPIAHWISQQTVSLPCGPHVDQEDVDYMAARIRETLTRLL